MLSPGAGVSTQPQYIVNLACLNQDCFQFEGLLTATLNASVDPCHDFKAYVTSRWLPDQSGQVSEQWRYKWHVRRDSAGPPPPCSAWQPGQLVVPGLRQQEPGERRRDAPVVQAADAQPERTVARGAAQRRGPIRSPPHLCVRWNMPLWFDVKLLPGNPIGGRKTVYIGPSVYAKFWASQYRLMHSDSAVQRYIDQYLAYFYDENARSRAGIVNYNAVFNFTKRVVFLLADVHKSPASTFFTFDSAANALGQPTDRLLSLMNGHFRPEVMFVQLDVVIGKKRGTADTARNIVASHDPTVVLSHLGWWMLQIYAPIADAKFFIQKYGSEEVADLLRPLFCETQVESSFKIFLLSSLSSLFFPQQVRQGIDELFDNVRSMTAILYEEAHLPLQAKARVVQMIRGMRINLWPSAKYQSPAELELVYTSHFTNKTTTLDHWITERWANAELIGSDAYFEDKQLPHSFAKDAVYYDSLLNTVSMSMLVAREPFYYPNGIRAVNYGGLGAAFAKSVLEGLANEPALRNVGVTEENGTSDGPSRPGGLDLGVPGFLPAFRAFQAHRLDAPSVRDLSPEELFFISYCHTQSRLLPAFDCNAVVRGAQSFASAFQCKQGSRMNP
ncbi:hypothetical protein V5799_024411 [Amblyomma americanum]|uniref:Uncharacterized protein n=1 Tax=Amblyomma americanum TaxID=6943 RepID=A0AAQ4EC56_AMBAM